MGKSYSVDLRIRVLSAIDSGLGKMQAHRTYHISRSTIDDWLSLREKTGSVEVIPSRAGRKGLHRQAAFAEFVSRHQHSTLEQMRVAWHKEEQQKMSLMAFSRALRAIGYTRKKRVISTAKDVSKKETFSRSR